MGAASTILSFVSPRSQVEEVSSTLLIRWSVFRNLQARSVEEHSGTWPEFVECLRRAEAFTNKEDAPLLKLATFGKKQTSKKSLRHDANVLEVHGIELDYDGGVVTMDDALKMLAKHGIRAVIHPTASSKPEKPRWRAFLPLAVSVPPEERERLVARANGVLEGNVSKESFALSQAYYLGSIVGSPEAFRVLTTFDDPEHGYCIDEKPELDYIAIGKSAVSPIAKPQAKVNDKAGSQVPLSPVVEQLIAETLPRQAGERNGSIFQFGRRLQHAFPGRSPDEFRDVVRKWHEMALPVIRTKEFAITWNEFVFGFDRVEQEYGAVMDAILAELPNTPLPLGIDTLGYGDQGNELVKVCFLLQQHHDPEPLFLSARIAGGLIDMHFTDANKVMATLVRDGVITLVKKGAGRFASRYRFIWCESGNSRLVDA